MALQLSPFPNICAAGVHAVGWALIQPCFLILNSLIALWKPTTLEKTRQLGQALHRYRVKVVFGSILFFILLIFSCFIAFFGFILWAPLQLCRRPFSYHKETQTSPEKETHRGFELVGKASFGFATANLCLLPNGLARFNNLAHTQRRATAIGQQIVQGVCRPHIRIFVDSPSSCGTLSPSNSILPTGNPSSYGATDRQAQPPGSNSSVRDHAEGSVAPCNSHVVCVPCDDTEDPLAVSPPHFNSNQNSNQQGQAGHRSAPRALLSQGLRQQDDITWEVSSLFPPNVDILCLEEVFDKRAAQKLTNALKPVFGHILYDIGVYSFQPPCKCNSFKFFNSGLFMASRFPIVEAQYHCFPNSRGEDALAAKGLLSTKVLIGKNDKQKNVVGFFNCTHLHAPEGEGQIRCEQLNMVAEWIGDFQAANRKPDEDVAFDVLCGDFNFDNCSPDDSLEQNHRLFDEYRDPCRAGPGKEKPWVIGTLLEQPTLYEDNIKTPENLQRTLEREDLRKKYISPPVPAQGCPLVYPEPGQPWIGRRIDYILYRELSISKHYKTEVEEVTFITQLAGLTDHVPVGLRLNVIMDS